MCENRILPRSFLKRALAKGFTKSRQVPADCNTVDTFARSLALFDFQNEINPGPFVLC